MLHGRDAEQARLAGVLRDARAGRAGMVLVHGEPGVGKTTLIDWLAADTADGVCVLRTQGVESEAPLAFAALHRLLRPVLGLLDRLPPPQARAMRTAFGLEFGTDDGGIPQPFLVALATLSMLAEAAENATVLCLVDDAQWLDQATSEALLTAGRRLGADRVAVVFAARDGEGRSFAPDGVPSLALAPLADAAARAVLTDAAGEVAADVADVLMAQTGGNPLALVELPTTLTPEQLRGVTPLPQRPQLTPGMERVFLDRCRRLPAAVQTLLLVAAADDSGQVATVRRAAALLGVPAEALEAAERSGMVVVDADRLRVRHPLVRSAVYQAATSGERRQVHRALADVADPADADRQAWHRAASVDMPDPGVVAALDDAAARAERRAGYAAAAAAYARAAELVDGDRPRAVRLFAAARNAWAAGETRSARVLVTSAQEHAGSMSDVLLGADIDRLRGRIEVNVGSAIDAHRIFSVSARDVAGLDPARALELAVAAALLRSHGADSGTVFDVRELAVAATAGDTVHRRCLGHLLLSLTQAAVADWSAASASLHAALREGTGIDAPDVLAHLGNLALHLGDDEAHRRCFTRMLTGARDAGDVMGVLYALPRLGFTRFTTGRWTDLRRDAEEGMSLSASAGKRPLAAVPLGQLGLLAAVQGRPAAELDALLADLEAAAAQPLGVLADPVHDLGRWARGVRAAHDGAPGTALHHFAAMRVATLHRLAALDRIEAAVRAGDRVQAVAWTEDLAVFAAGTGWAWAAAVVAHARALLAQPADVADLFDSALAHHARTSRADAHPYDRARTELAYGEWLRRSQRRVEARTHLRAALEAFEDLRATPLAARAAQELRASGETARKRDVSTALHLTPMERQVAELVRQGLSNKEIAAQCWVSHRTVAFHLRNVFAKVGVASRGELARLDLS
ncbi:LuxR family transcriptional regulator [Couchioplanes caeruleus]|uniref:helix-turn-helix transcriptional regulator n=1 Tax=Couchioplanes caeruleus TaxID=56438 RepID=UPI0020BD8F8A|nr:LuxR family transcriptional regulator [Couchioplanes caeruleus]UQU67601.1 LuxR family transcriptional regulator [Couchioplanes caeruleus]